MDSYVPRRDPRLSKRPRRDDFASNRAAGTSSPRTENPTVAVATDSTARQAPAPFNQTTADAVLRSCDAINFRVRSAILAEASPVFRAIFSSSSFKRKAGSSDKMTTDGLPIVTCVEKAEHLHVILLLCYPVEDPDIGSGQALCDVLKVALNYEMDYIVKKITKQFTQLASKEPLKMYMHACRNKWPKGMSIAARTSLARPIQSADLAEFEDIEGKKFISALELVRLQSYHKMCGQVASGVIGTVVGPDSSVYLRLPWLPNSNWVWFNCPHRLPTTPVEQVQIQNGEELIATKWWTAYLRKAQEKLRCRPSGGALLDTKPFAAFAAAATEHCPMCKRQVIEDLLTFNNLLAQEVERAIQEVEFDSKLDDKGCVVPITPW